MLIITRGENVLRVKSCRAAATSTSAVKKNPGAKILQVVSEMQKKLRS
jgi:hypothetical protein